MNSPIKHPLRFFAVAAIGTFIGTLEGSILNVALPTIAGDLGAEVDEVAWVVLAYSVTLVSLMTVFGAWAARRGYGFAYRFGYLFFLVGTTTCALSGDLHVLIAGRVVQAVGAAMFQAIGMGLLTSVFPANQRGKAIGLMAMVVAVGLTSGPPLGGLILSTWPWHAIFVVTIPVGIIGLLLSTAVFRGFVSPISHKPLNIGTAAALSVALLSAMLWLSFFEDFPFLDLRMLGLAVVGVIAAILFIRLELNPERSLIGLELFMNRQFSISVAAMFLMFASMAGALILIPFYLQDIRGLEPKTIGLYLIVLPLTMAMFAPLSGRISDRIGYRFLTSLGLAMFALGMYLLLQLEPSTGSWHLIVSLIVIGSGVGIFNSPNSSAMMGSVTAKQRPISSGILSTTRVLGMASGIAVSTAVFSYYKHRFAGLGGEDVVFVEAMHRVIWISIVMTVTGMLICSFRKNRLHDFWEDFDPGGSGPGTKTVDSPADNN
ncbi:MAG: MFS transporter [bacterium]